MTRAEKKFDLEDRLIEFTLLIISIVESLPDTKVCNHLAGQLLRSGTSPALNYGEAQSAESRKDFIHKLRIILKELRETRICLRVLLRKSLVKDDFVIAENLELIAIFMKSISTAKSNDLKK